MNEVLKGFFFLYLWKDSFLCYINTVILSSFCLLSRVILTPFPPPQGWLGLDCNTSLSELISTLVSTANGSWIAAGSGSRQDNETLAPDYDANPADTNTTDTNATDSDTRTGLGEDSKAGCTEVVPTTATRETVDTLPLDVGEDENIVPQNPTTKWVAHINSLGTLALNFVHAQLSISFVLV